MAATRAAAKNMFLLIGFVEEAATLLTTRETLESPADFQFLDDNRVQAIVKAIRRPGGPADGVAVSEKAEHNFGLTVKLLKYWKNTDRKSVV